jgi:hypothetical protein
MVVVHGMPCAVDASDSDNSEGELRPGEMGLCGDDDDGTR